MIDLVLIAFAGLVYWWGFWCGKTYGTFGAMKKAILDKLK